MSSSVSFFTHRSCFPLHPLGFHSQKEACDIACDVEFQRGLSREALWETIARYKNPTVIFWYIGANGFKAEGVRYYKEDLQRLLALKNGAEGLLYDMTAWGGLRKASRLNLEEANPNVLRVNAFGIQRLRALASSEFFQWIRDVRDPATIWYLKEVALRRTFIYEKSKTFYKSGLKVQQVFGRHHPVLDPLSKKDCAHVYSALQYLEGLYLVERLVEEDLRKEAKETNIVFALPDDEWEYYFDEHNAFLQDVKGLLGMKWGKKLAEKRLHIAFCCFTYGEKRPYNEGEREVKQIERTDLL